MNPNWVSMVNAGWFGAYGHGEGTHLLGYPAEIDWQQSEADFQKCRENFVQVVRAFIFENLDGCVKIGSIWDVSPEALLNLKRLKQLLFKSDDFSKYVSPCRTRGFLGAAPWSIHHDFPISEAVWQLIRDSRVAVIT